MSTGDPQASRAGAPGPADAAHAQTALDWAREQGETERVLLELAGCMQRRRQRRRVFAAAGAAMLLAFAAVWPAWRLAMPADPAVAVTNALVLRPETRALPDGSLIVLRAGADVVAAFGGHERRVFLNAGQAHFEVAKDATRPFVVVAGGVEVRAVGTAFSVDMASDAVEVVVTEGRVAVESGSAAQPATPAANPPAPEIAPESVFGAGKRVRVELPTRGAAPVRQVADLSEAEITERLSWRVPRLEFAGTPLAQALAMFEEHGGIRIALADPSLGRLQLSGVLRADNTESLLRLLDAEFGLVAEQSDGRWVLRKR